MDLQQFFKENPRVAIAFSGGVDSSYLLYAALRYGARVRAYYVNSAFQPRFELEDARRLAGDLHADLRELSVRSPLRECGLTKDEIRRLSREAGLFTWDKPAYACLATRIPTGQPITARDLAVTEAAETYLFSLGFTDFRVRLAGRSAKIQLPAAQMPHLLEHRQEILDRLGQDYDAVWLDLEARA